ncbi:MAG TPA: HAMP domain-containing sensor histidine kinase [Gemmatimonadaceae bacterium]|nr:HAMP domain-containing sensor histidine kinase [Gemmatimonadaceae bacterium]
MKRPRFRTRLFLILSLFAVVPSVVLTLLWGGTINTALPLVSAGAAWDRVAATGERAIAAAQSAPATPEQRQAWAAHEEELRRSLVQAKRFRRIATGTVRAVAVLALAGIAIIAFLASRVAGHLSRQLSRPLDELVKWTELLARGEPLPEGELRRGAPEFEVLRQRMRRTARELELGRARALEAERLSAFRETAQRVAHELKNPLTPIRFAVSRLRRDAPPELQETVEVLKIESERLEQMARSFAQFGRLPEGPAAEVDLGELARYTARATVPGHLTLTLDVEEGLPMVRGHYDALARALSNVLINAVEACREGGGIVVRVARSTRDGRDGIEVAVRDTGCGISPEQLGRIWEPYVTHKSGGTGLGLAIARQTVVAHRGSVDAVSAVGKGTEVRFLLPVMNGDGSTSSVGAGTGEVNALSG